MKEAPAVTTVQSRILDHFEPEGSLRDIYVFETGGYLNSLRECTISDGDCAIDLTQPRTLFGSHFVAHVLNAKPGQIDALRNVFPAMDVDLVVVPYSASGRRIPRW